MKKVFVIAFIAITATSCNFLTNLQTRSQLEVRKHPNGDTSYDLFGDSIINTAKWPKQIKELDACVNATKAGYNIHTLVDSTVSQENVYQYIVRALRQSIKDLKKK